jgi:16S rRNA (cytidine1402-2'-O)-methyltransferase
MKGKLYIAATPIGNYDDITFRVIKILSSVDFIICEEFKEARRLLSHLRIEKPLITLNEHDEKENSDEVLLKILQGESAALISDCGTPIFSDPGLLLVQLCIANKIDVVPLPGANSLMTALSAAGVNADTFYFAGWLSPKKDIRRKQLLDLKHKKELLVLMETPYRLKNLLSDVVSLIGKNTHIILAYQLTMSNEKFYRGTAEQILKIAEEDKLKGEFVLLINNRFEKYSNKV